MVTYIDHREWKVTGSNNCYFVADYNYNKKRFLISITRENADPGSFAKRINIGFDFVPKVGRYYFNNTGSIQKDSGTIGSYTYKGQYNDLIKWSSGGYVEITSISKDNIQGTFDFTVNGDAADTSTVALKEGSFKAAYGESIDSVWTGPR